MARLSYSFFSFICFLVFLIHHHHHQRHCHILITTLIPHHHHGHHQRQLVVVSSFVPHHHHHHQRHSHILIATLTHHHYHHQHVGVHLLSWLLRLLVRPKPWVIRTTPSSPILLLIGCSSIRIGSSTLTRGASVLSLIRGNYSGSCRREHGKNNCKLGHLEFEESPNAL